MKRIFRVMWNSEKAQVSKEYENWTKQQLIEKIKELESTPTDQGSSNASDTNKNPAGPSASKTTQKKEKKPFDFTNTNSRFVAIKFAYLGWNYNGLSYQFEPTPLPTVEEEILKALTKAKLIKEAEPGCCDFSRCGRTDKGVSAMNQVISLKVRSTLRPEEQQLVENDNKEIPYLAILNSMLPSDIRITAICLRPPPKFDARFSCDYRHYRYIIKREGLDIDLMNEAAKLYKGGHDFRNFCKIDGSKQITNYRREVHDSKIIPLDDEFVIYDLKGSAFLWHQVRSMVAVLLLIGQRLESPSLITELLDVEKYPAKPNYEMANDIPLILYDCVFPEMEWLTPLHFVTFNKNLKEYGRLKGYVLDHQLKAHVGKIMRDIVVQDEDKIKSPHVAGAMNVGDGRGRNFKKYIPILERDFGDSYQVVNERHLQKKKRKTESIESASI